MSAWSSFGIGVLFALLVMPAFVYLFFKFFVWSVRRKLVGLVEDLQAVMDFSTPLRIKLCAVAEPFPWLSETKAQRICSEMKSLGFEDAGNFEVPELQSASLKAFAWPQQSMYAYLCHHPAKEECFIDIIRVFEDGTSVTLSDVPDTGVDPCPAHRNLKRPGSTAADLVKELRKASGKKKALPASVAEAATRYEKGYAAIMDWRVERGGVSEDELMAQADEDTTEEELAAARVEFRMAHLLQLDELLRIRYEEKIGAVEWALIEDQAVIVHDRLTPREVQQMVKEAMPDLEEEVPLPKQSGRVGMNEIVKQLPVKQEMTKHGDIPGTVEADVYIFNPAGVRS